MSQLPASTVLGHRGDPGVEDCVLIDFSIGGISLDVALNGSASWELVEVLLGLVAEARELIELPWDLKAKICVVGPPDTANIWVLFEESDLQSKLFQIVDNLDASDTAADDGNSPDTIDGLWRTRL